MSRIPEGFTGRLYEAEVLGSGISRTHLLETAEKLGIKGDEFLAKPKALELVRQAQENDPTNPDNPLGRDLRVSVIDQLIEEGVLDEGEEDRVKFYNAVGTPLDHLYGVDAFIEFERAKNKYYLVTLDVTANENKLADGHKAEIVFGPLPDAVTEEDEYLKRIDSLAKQVVDIMRNKALEQAARRRVAA